jgi:hypothetical protein
MTLTACHHILWWWRSQGERGDRRRQLSGIYRCVISLRDTNVSEAIRTSETSVHFDTTWCYISKSCHPHTCCHENLKSHKENEFCEAYSKHERDKKCIQILMHKPRELGWHRYRDLWWAFVIMAINILVPWKARNFLTTWVTVSFLR